MIIRKFSDISDVNKLEMYDFSIMQLDADEEKLVLVGDRGYRYHYRVELIFIDVVYVACAVSFTDMGTFKFRIATIQEAAVISDNMDEYEQINIYCFEEDISRWVPPPTRKARKFFIAASTVEITVYYNGENLDDLLT